MATWLHYHMVNFTLLHPDRACNGLKVGTASDGYKSHAPEKNEA